MGTCHFEHHETISIWNFVNPRSDELKTLLLLSLQGADEQSLMDALPERLRARIAIQIHVKTLKKVRSLEIMVSSTSSAPIRNSDFVSSALCPPPLHSGL